MNVTTSARARLTTRRRISFSVTRGDFRAPIIVFARGMRIPATNFRSDVFGLAGLGVVPRRLPGEDAAREVRVVRIARCLCNLGGPHRSSAGTAIEDDPLPL